MRDFSVENAGRRKLGNPLTPMIDCIFLLLIFFLYSRFRTPEAELGADIPPLGRSPAIAQDVEVLKKRQILIEIDAAGDVIVAKVGRTSVTVARKTAGQYSPVTDELEALLRRRVQAEPESFAILKPGAAVPFGCIVWCFDSARLAGIEDVSFAPPGGEGLPNV